MAIGAIGRESGAVASGVGDLDGASAADLRLLKGAFRQMGINLATHDIAYARSTLTTFEAELGLRAGHVVTPNRRADSAMVLSLERHHDSGSVATIKVVDIESGKTTAETRRAQLRPRPPYDRSDDIESSYLAISQAIGDLQRKRVVLPDSDTSDRRLATRAIPTSSRDVIHQAQATETIEANIRGLPKIEAQDLGVTHRIEEIKEKRRLKDAGSVRDKNRGKIGTVNPGIGNTGNNGQVNQGNAKTGNTRNTDNDGKNGTSKGNNVDLRA